MFVNLNKSIWQINESIYESEQSNGNQQAECVSFAVLNEMQGFSDPSENVWFRVVLLICYTSLFVLGLIGNCHMIRLMAIHIRHGHTSARTVFMVNLLVADLLLCTCSLPITPLVSVLNRWIFGNIPCHLLAGTQSIAVVVSIWSLAVVVFNKYLHIVGNTRNAVGSRLAVFITAIVWLSAITLSLPYILVTELIDGAIYANPFLWPNGFCGYQCSENWHTRGLDKYKRFNSAFFLILNLILPALLITFCYWRILCKIHRDMLAGEHEFASALTRQQHRRAQANKRRIIIFSFSVIVGFVGAWLPILTRNFLKDFELEPEMFARNDVFVGLFTHFIAMSTVVTNPLLIWWLGRQNTKQSNIKLTTSKQSRQSRALLIMNSRKDLINDITNLSGQRQAKTHDSKL